MIRYISPKGRIGKIVEEQENQEQPNYVEGGASKGVSPHVRVSAGRNIQKKKSTITSRRIENTVRGDVRRGINRYVKKNNRLADSEKEGLKKTLTESSGELASSAVSSSAFVRGKGYIAKASVKAAEAEGNRLEKEAGINVTKSGGPAAKRETTPERQKKNKGTTAFTIRTDAGKLIGTQAGRAAGVAALDYQKKFNAGMIQERRKLNRKVNGRTKDVSAVTSAATGTFMKADSDDAILNKAWDTTLSVGTGTAIKTAGYVDTKVRVVAASRKVKAVIKKESKAQVKAKASSKVKTSSKSSGNNTKGKKGQKKKSAKPPLKNPARVVMKGTGGAGRAMAAVTGSIGKSVEDSVNGVSIGDSIANSIDTVIHKLMLPAMLILMIMAGFRSAGDVDKVLSMAPAVESAIKEADEATSSQPRITGIDENQKIEDDPDAVKLVYHLINELGMDKTHAACILTACQKEEYVLTFIEEAEESSYEAMLDGCIPAFNEAGEPVTDQYGEPVMVETTGYTLGIWTTDCYKDFCYRNKADALLIFETYYFGKSIDTQSDEYSDLIKALAQNMYMLKKWDGNMVIQAEDGTQIRGPITRPKSE